MSSVKSLYFFFFQAEDGIRDIGVTGVQTCALPIWWPRPPVLSPESLKRGDTHAGFSALRVDDHAGADPDPVLAGRSEERRVGKECRSRWSPHHEKKKNTRSRRARLRTVMSNTESE